MNLNVALCDDEIEAFQKVKRLFQEFSKENNVQIRIDWFSSGESLLECLEGLFTYIVGYSNTRNGRYSVWPGSHEKEIFWKDHYADRRTGTVYRSL